MTASPLTYISAFAGIEGFGFAEVGMKPVAFVESEPNAQTLLKRHYPDVPQIGDVKNAGQHNLPSADVICGGFPCQDVSTAGRRAGLAGEQSGLWFEFHRLLIELKPRWVVIENVPGLLSSNDGRDFAVVLGGLTGNIPQIPAGGWSNTGITRGNPNLWKVAWRVLDAQYFGVPQRRRRVFIVGHLTDGCAAEVLFERESSRRHPATGRKKGQGTTASLKAGAPSRRNGGSDPNPDEFIITQDHTPIPADTRSVVPHSSEASEKAEDLTRLPLVIDTTQITSPQNKSNPQPGDPVHTLSAHAHVPLLVGTLGAANGRNRGLGNQNETDMLVATLGTKSGSRTGRGDGNDNLIVAPIAFKWSASSTTDEIVRKGDYTGALRSSKNGQDAIAGASYGVRRLTPIECERLQGFPDNYTLLDANGKFLSDTARYEKLGNAVCRNVGMWIGRRIIEAEQVR